MRYTKQIFFFVFINLLLVLLSIYFANYTRKLEITNNQLQKDILKEREQLKINSIEFSLYNNPKYLQTLHDIYFSREDISINKKILSLSSFLNTKNNNVLLTNLNSK